MHWITFLHARHEPGSWSWLQEKHKDDDAVNGEVAGAVVNAHAAAMDEDDSDDEEVLCCGAAYELWCLNHQRGCWVAHLPRSISDTWLWVLQDEAPKAAAPQDSSSEESSDEEEPPVRLCLRCLRPTGRLARGCTDILYTLCRSSSHPSAGGKPPSISCSTAHWSGYIDCNSVFILCMCRRLR